MAREPGLAGPARLFVIAARRRNDRCIRERAAGKAPKTILIAAGRQLLVILNAMIRSQQPLRL